MEDPAGEAVRLIDEDLPLDRLSVTSGSGCGGCRTLARWAMGEFSPPELSNDLPIYIYIYISHQRLCTDR